MAVVKLVATLSSYGRRAVVVGGVADRYASELARAGQSNRRRAGTGSASPERATRPPHWPAGMAEGNRATFGPRVGLSSHGSPAKGGPKSKCLARLKIARTSAGPSSLTISDLSRFRFLRAHFHQTDLEFSPQEILNRSDPEAPPRLASGCWSGSTGRDWLPAGFHLKGFKLRLSSSPELLGARSERFRICSKRLRGVKPCFRFTVGLTLAKLRAWLDPSDRISLRDLPRDVAGQRPTDGVPRRQRLPEAHQGPGNGCWQVGMGLALLCPDAQSLPLAGTDAKAQPLAGNAASHIRIRQLVQPTSSASGAHISGPVQE